MNKNNFTWLLLLLILIFFSCSSKKNKGQTNNITVKMEHNKDSVVINSYNDSLTFIKLLNSNLNMSDERREERLLDSSFFEESTSSINDYVLYFNHVLNHKYEGYDESISGYLYNMFIKYPTKFNEFNGYLKKLQNAEQKEILKDVTLNLSFEFLAECSDTINCSEKSFFNLFPYLKNKNCSQYFQQMKRNNIWGGDR